LLLCTVSIVDIVFLKRGKNKQEHKLKAAKNPYSIWLGGIEQWWNKASTARYRTVLHRTVPGIELDTHIEHLQ
jgi:uncharacterized SAM-binding protein YcdF (DUF218 family)